MGLYWIHFTAVLDGEFVRERIPAESEAQAIDELVDLGYERIIITDVCDF